MIVRIVPARPVMSTIPAPTLRPHTPNTPVRIRGTAYANRANTRLTTAPGKASRPYRDRRRAPVSSAARPARCWAARAERFRGETPAPRYPTGGVQMSRITGFSTLVLCTFAAGAYAAGPRTDEVVDRDVNQ